MSTNPCFVLVFDPEGVASSAQGSPSLLVSPGLHTTVNSVPSRSAKGDATRPAPRDLSRRRHNPVGVGWAHYSAQSKGSVNPWLMTQPLWGAPNAPLAVPSPVVIVINEPLLAFGVPSNARHTFRHRSSPLSIRPQPQLGGLLSFSVVLLRCAPDDLPVLVTYCRSPSFPIRVRPASS